jgi:outer membrane protein assembly factor BamB
MKSLTAHRKQTASFTLVNLLAIAPLWLMLAAANTSAHAQTTPSPADWTQFLRDNMQRWNPYETVLGVGTVESLQLEWKNPVGLYKSGSLSASAVVNGVVYFGSDDGSVYALNANTGATLWSYATAGQVDSSPAVVNGVVYIGSNDHNIYALNASTGVKQWSFAAGNVVISSPAVANGVVYIGSDDHNMYALNASTGTKLWSYATGSFVESSPAVVNGVVYFGSHDGNIYALNANTGAKLWSYTTGGPIFPSPVVANGVVYITGNANTINGAYNVYALNASTGVLLWSYANDAGDSSPAVANGMVYIGSADGYVHALNASTGAQVWRYNPDAEVYTPPAVANGVVYVGSLNGTVYALNASTGAKLWNYTAPAGYYISAPTIVNGVLYIRVGSSLTGTGNAYAFALGPETSADLFLRIQPSATTVHQGDLLTFAFPVWNLGPAVAEGEVLSSLQVPAGTTFDYLRISGTPGLGTCTHPPYGGTGQIICHEGDGMAPNTTWTVRLTVKVTAPAGTTITESAATMSDTPDPNMANNMATVSVKVQ